jgi:hypothetical protein
MQQAAIQCEEFKLLFQMIERIQQTNTIDRKMSFISGIVRIVCAASEWKLYANMQIHSKSVRFVLLKTSSKSAHHDNTLQKNYQITFLFLLAGNAKGPDGTTSVHSL